ncbi:MAG: aspartate-semialdehyde dehydrogenase [Actinomycetota bacterium]|nr:aspartate-semialdehyde dehydrogenase [Actinomycetota bacterium]
MREHARIGVVGATGAVGTVTLELLAERGFADVRAFASARSARKRVRFGARELVIEEATPELLSAGDLDLCFFSVGTETSRELVPPAASAGVLSIDKSDAYRLAQGVPLAVAGVNDDVLAAIEMPPEPGSSAAIVANPNCSAIQLTCALKPLHDAAGLKRVRLATYQSMSGAGDAGIQKLRTLAPAEGDLAMDWDFDGEEFSEEWKLREETRKILGLPQLPLQATCVRVPVLVGHAQAVWVETKEPISVAEARAALAAAPHVRVVDFVTPKDAAGEDDVLVARIRGDSTDERGLTLWVVNDNLRKGAALNAVQVAELLLARRLLPV